MKNLIFVNGDLSDEIVHSIVNIWSEEIIFDFLEAGSTKFNFNSFNSEGKTLLEAIVDKTGRNIKKQEKSVFKVLLKYGADLLKADEKGNSVIAKMMKKYDGEYTK